MTGDRRLLKLAAGNLGFGIVAAFLAPIRLNYLPGLRSLFPPYGLELSVTVGEGTTFSVSRVPPVTWA